MKIERTRIWFTISFACSLLLHLLPSASYAATRFAASCNYTDVSSEVSAATAGDIVMIPAGICSSGSADRLLIAKGISIIGAGVATGSNLTKIIDASLDDDSSSTPATFAVSLTASYNSMLGGNLRGGSVLIHNNTVLKSRPNTRESVCGLTEEEGWTSGGLWCPACPVRTTWPANDPVTNTFIWNNFINGALNTTVYLPNTTTNGHGYDDVFIHENRDYFLHAPQDSGGKTSYVINSQCAGNRVPVACCSGVGAGSCSPGHFDALLFTSSGPNAYYPYQPYTCPHPLTGYTGQCDPSIVGTGGYNISSPPLSAPQKLRVADH